MSDPQDGELLEDLQQDDTDNVDYSEYASQKDALLFVVEVSESMKDARANKPSKEVSGGALWNAMNCIYKVMLQKVISSPSDLIGVLLYGTKETKVENESMFTNMYQVLSIEPPSASRIKHIKSIINDWQDFSKHLDVSDKPVALSNVVFCANQMFASSAPNLMSKRLMLITDNDDPHVGDKSARKAAITRARDLYDLGIRIEPMFLSSGHTAFDVSKFYEELLFPEGSDAYDDQDVDLIAKGQKQMTDMMNKIRSKETQKRAIFSVPLEVAPDLQISVKGYILFKRQSMAKTHWVYTRGRDPRVVKPDTTYICADTSMTVGPNDTKSAYKFGGSNVLFSQDSLEQIRKVSDPIIRIIGFKPAKSLQFWANVRPSYFIYPTESEIVGSTRTFAALHKKLSDADVMGIAWFVQRKKTAPAIVAMVAAPERAPSEQTLGLPSTPGIYLIQLPFADDIRANPVHVSAKAPDELIDSMNDVVSRTKLRGEFNPESFPNPSLQWQFKMLQAIALEEDMPEQDEDATLPNYNAIQKQAGKFIAAWNETTDQLPVGQLSNSSLKRKAPT